MKQFFKIVISYALIVLILAGSINLLYLFREKQQNYGSMDPVRNDQGVLKDIPTAITVCNFGNSHGYYGFNYQNVTDEVCYNFALPDQSLSNDLQILKAYRDRIAEGATVFLTISFTSVLGPSGNSSPAPMDKRYYRFLPREYIIGYDAKTDLYTNFLPAFAADDMVSLFEKLLNLNNHADMWNSSTTAEEAAYHGPMRFQNHVAAARNSDGSWMVRESELNSLRKIIAVCQEIGATPVLITLPYLQEYTDPILEQCPDFYDTLHGLIETVCTEYGVNYYDFSLNEEFRSSYNYYFNSDHMNRFGAGKFVQLLCDKQLF